MTNQGDERFEKSSSYLYKQWFSQEFFLGGAKFRARGFAARLFFLLASLAKKLKHQGRSQDHFRDCGVKDFKNFPRRQ